MHAARSQAGLRIAAAAVLVALAASAIAHLLGANTTELAAWLPPCPFRSVTGWPCPGCGMTRALLLLSQLEWRPALALHPAAPVLLAVLGWIVLRPRVLSAPAHPALAATALGALLALWVLRLATGAAI